MKTIKMEKFINGQHEKTTHVPAALVDMLSSLLPQSGIHGLQEHGIDLPALERALKEDKTYSKAVEMKEGGTLKKIVISVE